MPFDVLPGRVIFSGSGRTAPWAFDGPDEGPWVPPDWESQGPEQPWQQGQDDLRCYNFETGEWSVPSPPTTPPTPYVSHDYEYDYEERFLAFLRAGFAAGPALRLAQSQEPVPAQEQAPVPVQEQEKSPINPPPLTTIPDLPSPPATPLASAPPLTTPRLDVQALEELSNDVQAQVEGLVQAGIECDEVSRGSEVTESEQGQGMGKGAKKLHGQQQLEELLHLVEVEELEELEEPLPVGQTSGRARCSAGHKVWNPGGSQR